MKKSILFRAFAVVTAMMCALGASAAEAYACYTSSNTTLTFYYDDLRRTRPGTTYDLNTDSNYPEWYDDGTYSSVSQVEFDPSFADARPTSTYMWFFCMMNLESITGIEYLNTENVTNMGSMFNECTSLTSLDLSHFNTEQTTNMISMFSGCSGLTSLDLSSFNTAKVTNMGYLFRNCSSLTSLDLSCFNTALVTDMRCIFQNCSGLTSLDLSNFNTSGLKVMTRMFFSCTNLTTIWVGGGWNTDAAYLSTSMFQDCTSLVGGMGTTYSADHVDKAYAHIDGGPDNPGYFSEKAPEAYACYTPDNTTLTFYYDTRRSSRPGMTYGLNTGINDTDWDTDGTKDYVTKVVFDPSFVDARPTTTCDWFYQMVNLQSITCLNYLNTSEVTSMRFMFTGCRSLTSLDLSSFNTSKVTDMRQMFSDCSGLTSLDLSSFNTSQVTIMLYLFYNTSNLRTIYVGNGWSTAALTYSNDMFYNCTSLVGGQGTTYNSSNPRDQTYAHIDGGPSDPGYFTEKPSYTPGDVNGDNNVSIADVTALIDYLLSGDDSGINLAGADCNQNDGVSISDVTALIDYLLSGSWD